MRPSLSLGRNGGSLRVEGVTSSVGKPGGSVGVFAEVCTVCAVGPEVSRTMAAMPAMSIASRAAMASFSLEDGVMRVAPLAIGPDDNSRGISAKQSRCDILPGNENPRYRNDPRSRADQSELCHHVGARVALHFAVSY